MYCRSRSVHRTRVSLTARMISIRPMVERLIAFCVITNPDKTLPIVPKTIREENIALSRYTPMQVHPLAGTPLMQVHPQAGTPPWAGTPEAGTPWQVHPQQCMLGYDQQAGSTHPTGMHSCWSIFLTNIWKI